MSGQCAPDDAKRRARRLICSPQCVSVHRGVVERRHIDGREQVGAQHTTEGFAEAATLEFPQWFNACTEVRDGRGGLEFDSVHANPPAGMSLLILSRVASGIRSAADV
jgi:hypothetical protein